MVLAFQVISIGIGIGISGTSSVFTWYRINTKNLKCCPPLLNTLYLLLCVGVARTSFDLPTGGISRNCESKSGCASGPPGARTPAFQRRPPYGGSLARLPATDSWHASHSGVSLLTACHFLFIFSSPTRPHPALALYRVSRAGGASAVQESAFAAEVFPSNISVVEIGKNRKCWILDFFSNPFYHFCVFCC